MSTRFQNQIKALPSPAPSRLLQRTCGCGQHTIAGSECSGCSKKRGPTVQRSAISREPGNGSDNRVPPIVHEVLRSPGHPLDATTRAFFEPRFGHDFSQVRVHSDAQAGGSAQSVKALAYTLGHDLVFAPGEYQPQTFEGKRLLAHELTHVIQQRGLGYYSGAQHRLRVSDKDDPSEREAEAMAGRIMTQDSVQALTPEFRTQASHLTSSTIRWSESPQTKAGPEKRGARGIKSNQEPLCRLERDTFSRQASNTDHTPPPYASGCAVAQDNQILAAAKGALGWIEKGVAKLNAYLAKPTDAGSKAARDALNANFKNTTTKIGVYVLSQLNRVLSDLKNLNMFVFNCPGSEDKLCDVAAAYVPGDNPQMVVFCDSFFASNSIDQREILVHELAHAAVGDATIIDRGYESDRSLKQLTTEEALTNAESYMLFVSQLATGQVAPSLAPVDKYDACPTDLKSALDQTLARAQRWNRDAQVAITRLTPEQIGEDESKLIGGKTHADLELLQTAVNQLAEALESPISFECEEECESGTGVYFYPLGDLHICPKWSKWTADFQTLSLLYGLYGYAGGVTDIKLRWGYARFAQSRANQSAPALSTILGSPAWNADYLKIRFQSAQLVAQNAQVASQKEYFESGSLHQRMSKEVPAFQAPPCQTTKLSFMCGVLFAIDEKSVPRPSPFTPLSASVVFSFMTPNGKYTRHEKDTRAAYVKPGDYLEPTFPVGFNFEFTKNGPFEMKLELQDPDTGVARVYEDSIQIEAEKPCKGAGPPTKK